MNRVEFREWAEHLARRFPATGNWIMALPNAVRDAWFDECFADLELRDCLAVNVEMVKTGEIAAYDRERIPSIMAKRASEVRQARLAKERARCPTPDEEFIRRARNMRGEDAFGTLKRDRVMGRALRSVTAGMHERRKRGDLINEDVIKGLVDRAFDDLEYDQRNDDALSGPTYRCLQCRDTGLVSQRDWKDRPMVGYCGQCDKGMSIKDKMKWASGRLLGMATQECVEWEILD